MLFEKDDYTRITFARVEEAWLFNPSADTDNDGMPNAWELLHGLNPSLNDAGFDPDSDGASHKDEHAAGTDPQNTSSFLRVASFDASGGIDLQWGSVPGRSYAIEESDDLTDRGVVPGFGTVLAKASSTACSLPADDLRSRFFRVQVLP